LKTLLSLDLLEVQLPESTVLSAERYLLEGRVDHLREIDKHLWQARVLGTDKTFEPEVQMRGNFLKAHTCDCSLGHKKLPCNHVASVLFLLRRLRDQRRIKREGEKKFVPEIQVKRLLLLVPTDDQAKFIRDWAQVDNEFALAFKARFFHNMGSHHHIEYLEQLFAPYILDDGSLAVEPEPALKPLRLLIKQLLAQTEDLLIKQTEDLAFANLNYLIQKFQISGSFRQRPALIRQIIQLITRDEFVQNLDPESPRFQFLLDTLNPFMLMKEDFAIQMLLLSLQSYAGFATGRQRINALIGYHLRKGLPKQVNSQSFILVYYQTLNKEQKEGPWIEQLELPRLSPVVYEHLCQTLVDTGDFEGADRLLAEGLTWYPHYMALLRIKANLFWEMHRKRELPAIMLNLIQTSLEPNDLAAAKKLLSEKKWPAFLLQLRQILLALPATYERNVMLSEIHCDRKEWTELSKILVASHSPRLFQRFIQRFPGDDIQQIIDVYNQFLAEYLDQHIGPKSTVVVQNLFATMEGKQQNSLKKAISQFLKKRYPERPQLLVHSLTIPMIPQHEN
jgi:hypothetical protein